MNTEAALNLLVDFIVYMALEDISFFRFLDFNDQDDACKALLSWLDFEYLDPSGNYRGRYDTQVKQTLCDATAPLQQALKVWATEKAFSKKKLSN